MYVKKLKIINTGFSMRKTLFCGNKDIFRHKIREININKDKKIFELLSNIYIYKFPPVLYWYEGYYKDIPVDYVIAMRKIFEHTSSAVLEKINELCFAFNAEYSSYGDNIIILPIEYIYGNYDKRLFLDSFAHEIGHALYDSLTLDAGMESQISACHKIIKFYSKRFSQNLFYDPGVSELSLAGYQLEDCREFFPELFLNVLNYYEELIAHICSIKYTEAAGAYL